MRCFYRWLLLMILAALPGGVVLFSQAFKPAENRAEMDAMLKSLTLSDWADIQPGHIYYLRVDLSDAQKEVASEHGNVPPEHAILSIGLPTEFDVEKIHPILFTSVTGNIYAPNAYSIRNYYQQTLRTEWVVVSVDGDRWPEQDTIVWRIAMMEAAIRYLDEHWPMFKHAPLAFGGFSGGAKISVYLTYFSALIGKRPCGLFLGGCNYSPHIEAAKMTGLDRTAIRDIPVFYSMGEEDKVATIRDSRKVTRDMARAGFRTQEIAMHPGGHRLDGFHLLEALQYFRSFFPEVEEPE